LSESTGAKDLGILFCFVLIKILLKYALVNFHVEHIEVAGNVDRVLVKLLLK
jgi:uncharacterized membrane protein YwzB